jgi:hypothetical protein
MQLLLNYTLLRMHKSRVLKWNLQVELVKNLLVNLVKNLHPY